MKLFSVLSVTFWVVAISLWPELALVFLFYLHIAYEYYQHHALTYNQLGALLYAKHYSLWEFIPAHIITAYPFILGLFLVVIVKWWRNSKDHAVGYQRRLYSFHDRRIKSYFKEKQNQTGGAT